METATSPALLLIDLPPSALAGIDLLSFTVTPRFRGVKELPPGYHFCFAGTSTAFSERHGLWFYVPGRQNATNDGQQPLFIAKWNKGTETLDAEPNEAERLRWRANLGSVWREGLTPYRQTTSTQTGSPENDEVEEEANDWPTLTSHIASSLLSRITGGDSHHWHLTSASSSPADLENIPGLDSQDITNFQADRPLHLLSINLKQTWPEGATGRQRTEAAQDRSWALLNATPNPDELLGELQFTFLMILTLNNFSCLEQWKRLLTLIFTYKSYISENPDFFIRALAALRLQLQHCRDAEGGLIDLADEGGSLLKSLLQRFRRGLESLKVESSMAAGGVSDVTDELDDLEEYLRREHGWQFGGGSGLRAGVLELEDGEQVQMESTAFDEEDELGEFAPQVVELTDEQARLLNITPEDARDLGLKLSKTSLADRKGVAGVVQESDDEEDEDSVGRSEDDEEEMQDLDEMDSRF